MCMMTSKEHSTTKIENFNNQIKKQEMKALVIIGNGFDLNLGLKTSYRHFIESEECKTLLAKGHNYFLKTILGKYNLYNWVDIEEEFKTIAKTSNGLKTKNGVDFQADYREIVHALEIYLINTQKNCDLKKNSIAACLFEFIVNYPHEFDIFSFNYTDLCALSNKLQPNKPIFFSQVHGNLKDHSIILGFEDDVEGIEDYSYMIKSFSPNYESKHLRQALGNAKEVIIFGHSLGSTDYQYFSEFFNAKSSPGLSPSESVRISIITANESSKIAIMKQLRRMNNNRTNILLDQNDVNFYYTCDFNVMYSIHNLFERLHAEIMAKKTLIDAEIHNNVPS